MKGNITKPPLWKRLSKRTLWVLLVLGCLLIAVRAVLPTFVQRYVNKKLDSLPQYDGRIGDVDLHIWRGAYSIEKVDIVKTDGDLPIPFFKSDLVEFSIEWKELWHRKIVTEINIFEPEIHFVKGSSEEQSQTGIDNSWIKVVQDLTPFRINRFEISHGQTWFHDATSNPTVDIYVTNLFAVATNLTNSRELSDPYPASVRARGKTLGEGNLELALRFNPLSEKPTFDLNAAIDNMDLTAFNDFLEAYAKVDVKKGRFRFYTELVATNGQFVGYAKPLLEDLDIVDLSEDAKHPLKLVWKTIVAGAVHIFKNHSKDRFAAKIPLSGDLDDPKVGIWSSVASLLRNAFIQALSPRIEESVGLERKSESKKADPLLGRKTGKD
jgi:hypothetical protein